MAKYDDTNTFVIFKQDVEEGSNKPIFTGEVNVDGVKKRLAGWVNKDPKGKVRVNGKVSDFETKPAAKVAEESPF
tara:strand:+ start:1381 stop:1605 length:225 start_codon:yes stop_codon:yes gene_type:complete